MMEQMMQQMNGLLLFFVLNRTPKDEEKKPKTE